MGAPLERRLATAPTTLALEGRIVRFLSRRFGPYPFDAVGGIVDDKPVGAALENQTLRLSEQISGRRLGGLFHEMLFRPAKPRLCAQVRGGPVSAQVRATVRTLMAAARPGS